MASKLGQEGKRTVAKYTLEYFVKKKKKLYHVNRMKLMSWGNIQYYFSYLMFSINVWLN